ACAGARPRAGAELARARPLPLWSAGLAAGRAGLDDGGCAPRRLAGRIDLAREREGGSMRLVLMVLAIIFGLSGAAAAQGGPDYGVDPGGMRYSAARQITRDNVGKLTLAWTYHTGEAARRGAAFQHSSFEGTPVLADGKLVLCTPFDRVVALDPATGREIWVFDPAL